MIGFKIISEMTPEELIDEIISNYRETLQECGMTSLRAKVVELRLTSVRNSLLDEAGLKTGRTNAFGLTEIIDVDDDNENSEEN